MVRARGGRLSAILADPVKRTKHVAHIRALVRDRGYDGIDIDYEHSAAADRRTSSDFVTALAVALHADGKQL